MHAWRQLQPQPFHRSQATNQDAQSSLDFLNPHPHPFWARQQVEGGEGVMGRAGFNLALEVKTGVLATQELRF